jgi:hypothetical protein
VAVAGAACHDGIVQVERVVVGAGIAGLACAEQLAAGGGSVVVLEKSRGLGGRCATRRVDEALVDHGLCFYHGDDVELRARLEEAGGDEGLPGWPRRIRGAGVPCQPRAFRAAGWRLAQRGGVTAFPKHLARGLDVRLQTHVTAVEPRADSWCVVDASGRERTYRDLVLALPAPQARALIDPWRERGREVRALHRLLSEIGLVPALAVLALYPSGSPTPAWEMWYPEDSAILQLISHDSSKRGNPSRTALVLQALPGWSRHHAWEPPERWSAAMIEEAARLAGRWAAAPETVQSHRWQFARIASGGDLAGPMLIEFEGGQRLGVAGEGFSPGGGVQAAWRSGRELARRLSEGGAA